MTVDLTALLRRVNDGDADARQKLYELTYADLHAQARRYMRGQRSRHTLQPTALIHEAYLRLVRPGKADWVDRTHFLAAAARAMRCILVDHARARNRLKRRGDREQVPLDSALLAVDSHGVDVLALDEALEEFAEADPRAAAVVELRFFGGLSMPEIARHLKIGTRTAEREWELARVWLRRRLA